jgi:hypothetical protein
MVEDDSRKVAESAEAALAAAALRVSPEALELVAIGDHAEGELLLDGSPIALCATATSDEPWLHVEQDGSGVRVKAYLGDIQRLEGRLVLTGPITERLEVPVVVRAAGSSGKTESAPVPTPAPPPDTARSVAIGAASTGGAGIAARARLVAAPKLGLFDGPSLDPRGLLLLLVDLILLVLGGIIATTAGLDASVGVIPVAAAVVIITCLIMRAPAVRPLGDACDRRGCSRVRGSRTTEARGLLEREREHQRAAGICRLCDPLRCADAGCGPGVPVQPRGDSRRAA